MVEENSEVAVKISVITWDGSFREHMHTIDAFCNQDFPQSEFEFIWVDFYSSSQRVRQKIGKYGNARLMTLDRSDGEEWHLGECLNAGVKNSSGELLVIADGDIVVEPDFLTYVQQSHEKHDDLALFFRRYDEPQHASCDASRSSTDYLKHVCKLTNSTNYAACLSLKRRDFDRVKGYETHRTFSGAGANGLEIYNRLRNAGMVVKWASDKRSYHPWHSASGSVRHDDVSALRLARQRYNWIIPNVIPEQSWIIHRRGLSVATVADAEECDKYLSEIPEINMEFYEKTANADRLALSHAKLDELRDGLINAKLDIIRRTRRIVNCEGRVERMEASVSWRITEPLRKIHGWYAAGRARRKL